MKTKTPNNTKSHSSLSKLKVYSKYYTSKYFDYWKKVSMEDKVNELISFMYEYLSDPKNTDIFSGVLEYGMPQATYETWLLRSDDLKHAHKQFRLMVAKNLLSKAENRDNQTIMKRLRRYHPDLIDDLLEEREFKEKMIQAKGAAVKEVLEKLQFVGNKVERTELVDNAIKRAKNHNRKPE